MFLKSLRLNNIRSYTSQNISFNKGSSLLLGDIGSGKTTILLAIEFALFGLIKGDVSGNTLLRHGKKDGSVELEFELDGKNMKVVRKLKRGKDNTVSQEAGQIITDNMVFDGTPIELKSKILEMFGYPEELLNKNTSLIYRYTVYAPQEEMKRILFESRDERLDTLRKIFNIDRYKRIRENALIYAKELRNTKKIYESRAQDLEQLENEFSDRKKKKEDFSKSMVEEQSKHMKAKSDYDMKLSELKNSEDDITKLNNFKKNLEINAINIRNKKAELEKGNKDLGMTTYRINEYSTKLKDLGAIDQSEEEIRMSLKDSEEKLSKINSAKEIIGKRLEDKNKDMKNIIVDDVAALRFKHQSIMKRLEKKSEVERNLKESQENLERVAIEINTMNINKASSLKIINQLKDLDTCPLCLQKVDFSHKIKISDRENASVQNNERKILEFEAKRKDLSESVNRIKNEIEDMHRADIELKETIIKLENLGKQQDLRAQLTKEIEELNSKKEKLDKMDVGKLVEIISKGRKILSNIEVKKHIGESLKEKSLQKRELEDAVKGITDELKKFTEEGERISKEISQYSDIENNYKIKKSELEKLSTSLKDIEISIASLKKDMENNDAEISKLSKNIDEKKILKQKINYIGELNFWITEHLVNLTSTIEKSVMQKIHMEFNELFQKWFSMLMDDENIYVRVDEEFTPVITQNNYETEVMNLSGGEKTSVALAYRLALNKVINDLINTIKTKDVIILDEPTDGFSSDQLDKMRDVLYELGMKQMILVSHEPKMESYVENIIHINKNEHESEVLG